jgi:hypothetical protein
MNDESIRKSLAAEHRTELHTLRWSRLVDIRTFDDPVKTRVPNRRTGTVGERIAALFG